MRRLYRLVYVCAVGSFLILQAGFVLGQEMETYVEKYRRRGPDPMVSKIIETEEKKIDDIPEDIIETDIDTTKDEPKVQLIYKIALNRHDKLARISVMKREYEKVIQHCEEGLKTVKEVREQKNIAIPESTLSDYTRNFTRWKQAAQEGIIAAEALENFKKRQITLEGVIWDEVKPVVILDGNSFRENDPYKGVRIDKITPSRVDVVFIHKGRPFRYTLEFPE